jgi:glycosyltransferase involved in cell wall biosynthesis
MRFCIVTPCRDAAAFIDETIFSVISQAGPFSIRYHVQDGGSTDCTIEKLERWRRVLDSGSPFCCNGIKFSYASTADSGMYHAVDRGFRACGEGDVLAWINADDRYMPSSFAVVGHIFGRWGDIDWLTGRISIVTEAGFQKHLSARLFPRKAIRAGVFDLRRFPRLAIAQDSTFWRARLWESAGGVDATLRLAGDYDIWRRFAEHADLVTVDATLSSFRERPGQLSQRLSAYHAEVDERMTDEEKLTCDRVAAEYQACRTEQQRIAAGFSARVVLFDPVMMSWKLVTAA